MHPFVGASVGCGVLTFDRGGRYVYAAVMLHFFKRELETLFVHRFSHGTMPFTNVFKK